jgi:hypothetical protein
MREVLGLGRDGRNGTVGATGATMTGERIGRGGQKRECDRFDYTLSNFTEFSQIFHLLALGLEPSQ